MTSDQAEVNLLAIVKVSDTTHTMYASFLKSTEEGGKELGVSVVLVIKGGQVVIILAHLELFSIRRLLCVRQNSGLTY